MKAPNKRSHELFKVPKNSAKEFFYINFYPDVTLGMHEFMHQVSCLTLCFHWMHDFLFFVSKFLKSGNFI